MKLSILHRALASFSTLALLVASSGEASVQLLGKTTRISISSQGVQGDLWSLSSSISADGRFVAFDSYATNLVPGDTNNAADVFVHDRRKGETTRVSVSSQGAQGVGSSPSISSDGHCVAFYSKSAFVAGDSNSAGDVFVHDRRTGVTTQVSVSSQGLWGNKESSSPKISADGRFVAFASQANNLVPGDTNGKNDIFVHDRLTGATVRASVSSQGEQGNEHCFLYSISADGHTVAFWSEASNLVSGDSNSKADVFVHELITGDTTRVSISSLGRQGNHDSKFPSLSADGRFVAFHSLASNLVTGDTNFVEDVFLHDRLTGETTRVSVSSQGEQGNKWSIFSSISADGSTVAFGSLASNLVSGDSNGKFDVFIHDRQSGGTTRVSVSSQGAQGSFGSYSPSLSADGLSVAFISDAENLVVGDTNGHEDVFVHDRP